MRLLDAELRRFFARRIVRLALLAALLLVVVVQTVIGVRAGTTREQVGLQPAPECVMVDDFGNLVPKGGPECLDERGFVPVYQSVDRRPRIADNYVPAAEGIGFPFLLASVILGASFVGAEWMAGSVGTLLLFEPRRWRVYLVKAMAAALGVAVCGLILYGWLAAVMAVNSQLRGVTDGLNGDFARDALGAVARVLGVGMLAAAIGVAGAAALRRTAAVIGLLFGFALFEPAVLARWGIIDDVPFVGSFGAIVVGSWTEGDIGTLGSLSDAVRVAVVWTAVFVILGGLVFSRREVR